MRHTDGLNTSRSPKFLHSFNSAGLFGVSELSSAGLGVEVLVSIELVSFELAPWRPYLR